MQSQHINQGQNNQLSWVTHDHRQQYFNTTIRRSKLNISDHSSSNSSIAKSTLNIRRSKLNTHEHSINQLKHSQIGSQITQIIMDKKSEQV